MARALPLRWKPMSPAVWLLEWPRLPSQERESALQEQAMLPERWPPPCSKTVRRMVLIPVPASLPDSGLRRWL